MNTTEKLILLVQSYPCLYNTRDRDYKNSLKKEMIWKKISKELNQSRDTTKVKWKNLKDGYTKYKKQIMGTMGQSKKYFNWVWGPNLQFLDSAIQPRPTTSNVGRNSVEINSPSKPPASTNRQVIIADPMDELSPSSPPSITTDRETPLLSPEILYSPEAPAPMPPNTKENKSIRKLDSQGGLDKVLNYLNNRKKRDAVDYLFASYAETFKKLKPRTQAKTKLKLAHIFTEAELEDLEET